MREHQILEATPEKRIFWSIISDYGLLTAICELVDNAIDLWQRSESRGDLEVKLNIDTEQQTIVIVDNAGGVEEENLAKLVTPGGSDNDPTSRSIGIFGVGSKRAGVALGQSFRIKTRYKNKQTFMIQVDDDWLQSASWDLPSYEVANIDPGSTIVEISSLRAPMKENAPEQLGEHLGAVYGRFLKSGLHIKLNGKPVDAITFDQWTFPPEALPHRFDLILDFPDLGKLDVALEGGLISNRDKEKMNYGVYFYCNDRLVVKDWKERAVGYYVSQEAGVPHPDASLARVVISLDGPARAMPWNSSKDGINVNHKVFQEIQGHIVELSSHYTKASRRWKNEWNEKVFQHLEGKIEQTQIDSETTTRLRLPPAPEGAKHYATSIKNLNSGLIKAKPWTLGLIESMSATKLMRRQKFDTKNRIALILLDSNLEISFKEFIVNNRDKFPSSKYTDEFIKNIIDNRSDVIKHVSKFVDFSAQDIKKMENFYLKRNKIIHERATVGVSNEEVAIYEELVESVLRKLFNVRFPR